MNAFKRAFQLFSRQPKENILFPEEPLGRSVSERGGFYGAALHSTLNSRYTLIGKLGWGIHASVWLARDQRCVINLPTDAYSVSTHLLSQVCNTKPDNTLSPLRFYLLMRQNSKAGSRVSLRSCNTSTILIWQHTLVANISPGCKITLQSRIVTGLTSVSSSKLWLLSKDLFSSSVENFQFQLSNVSQGNYYMHWIFCIRNAG